MAELDFHQLPQSLCLTGDECPPCGGHLGWKLTLGPLDPMDRVRGGTHRAWHLRSSWKCPHLNMAGALNDLRVVVGVPGQCTSSQEILMCPQRDLTIKYTQAGKTASNVGPSERSLALYFAINIHGAEIASEDKELG